MMMTSSSFFSSTITNLIMNPSSSSPYLLKKASSSTSAAAASSMVMMTGAAPSLLMNSTHYSTHCAFDATVGLLRWRRRKGRSSITSPAMGCSLMCSSSSTDQFPSSDFHLPEVQKAAREKFTEEVSFWSSSNDDANLSLAKALLYIAAEDEAFMAIDREMDSRSLLNEGRNSSISFIPKDYSCLEAMPLAGKSISAWLSELDIIAKEVEAELVSRDIGCHLMEVMEAVNFVLFELRGFKRLPVLLDSKLSYLHTVLSSGSGSAILLSIIYIEVCRRIGVTIVGSRVGEDFLIWPQTGNPEELFKVSSGHSLFFTVNGRCVEDPSSKASDLRSKSLSGLEIATNKDIIGIALANLIRLHWKRASRMNHGLMLTSPLRPVDETNEKFRKVDDSKLPLLRPLELRLAIMASERLLILQPHNWSLRRDHGMLLFYSRKYAEAVQELSICMAFAPMEEAEVLEPFVEKLHLLRVESSWKSMEHDNGRLTVP